MSIEEASREIFEMLRHATALHQTGRLEEAERLYRRVLQTAPDQAEALQFLGVLMAQRGSPLEAAELIDRAISADPSNAGAFNNRGGVFLRMRRFDQALADYDQATALNPADPDRHYNRGNVLIRRGRGPEALAAYEKTLALSPEFAAARQAHGSASFALGDYERAFLDYDAAFRLDPDRDYLEGYRLHAKMHICDWTALPEEMRRLVAHVREGKHATEPFMLLPVWSSAEDQLRCALTYAADRYPPNPSAAWKGEKYRHEKIRIAYMSGEFREQATSYLTADLFECHDRTAFSTYGIATGASDGSPMRRRLEKGFDVFTDMTAQSDAGLGQFIREPEIEILVNLNGYFGLGRTAVFAMRPAPIQVNYLGYPGTMGAPYMDYIIADARVIPDDERGHYSESVCSLPDTYQPNDRKKAVSCRVVSRAECALPQTGVIFCCFNNNHKILPDIFDIWMRLLAGVDGSVLWLLEGNAAVRRNLTAEAEKRGISPERLVFAPMIPLAGHLARERLAGFFFGRPPAHSPTPHERAAL